MSTLHCLIVAFASVRLDMSSHRPRGGSDVPILNSEHVHVTSHHSIDTVSRSIVHHKCNNPCAFNCCLGMLTQTSRVHTCEDRPYSGDFRGMTWNARAFFAQDGVKMSRRIKRVRGMCASLDFFGIQETHSSPERVAALQTEFPNHVLFWSHCSQMKGGLALGISVAFLEKFSHCSWKEIEQGRVGKLELRGRGGSLDLFCLYLDDQSAMARAASFSKIRDNMSPQPSALSVIFGDLNFVEHKQDRFCKTTGQFSGCRDSANAKSFKDIVLQGSGLFELNQEHHTFEGGRAMSRLDRVYVNWHASEQLDAVIECAATSWPLTLSDHRPELFARRSVSHSNRIAGVARAIPSWTLEHESWVPKVKQHHVALMLETKCSSSHEELQLLKKSMKRASAEVAREHAESQVTTQADKLSCTMSFVRCAERGDVVGQIRNACKYTHLSSLVDPRDSFLRESRSLNQVRDHAVELASTDLSARLHELSAARKLNSAEYTSKKEQRLVRLKRMLPGSTTALSAMEDPVSCQATSDPKEMARLLIEHWGRILTAKPVDRQLLSRWLRDLPDKVPQAADACWTLTREHVAESRRRSHETSPGPDGIPYMAYRKLGSYAVACLHSSAEDLQETDCLHDLPSTFNHAILRCLPKSPSRTDGLHGDVYTPAKTRPLSIVNTDNRLIANAYRLLLEPVLNKWISEMQRGFLPGRSMLSNVVDVDYEAMRISLKHPRGAIILFDFAAAFPSLSQDYMWSVLSHIGLPPNVMQAIRCPYMNNMHFVKVKGTYFPSLTATSGVRQGCPLSPLLFAVVADVLLRRLGKTLPQALIRAFADDTAVVVPNFASHAPCIMTVFSEFAKMSNLHLNLSKTVLVPLWPSSETSIRRWLRDDFSDWAGVEISWAARYVGFYIGPLRGTLSWSKPQSEFKRRVIARSSLHLGMHFSSRVYRTFCVALFGFLSQLEDIPESVLNDEPWALRRVAPGPGNWVCPVDLHHLSVAFNFPLPSHASVIWPSQPRCASTITSRRCIGKGISGSCSMPCLRLHLTVSIGRIGTATLMCSMSCMLAPRSTVLVSMRTW